MQSLYRSSYHSSFKILLIDISLGIFPVDKLFFIRKQIIEMKCFSIYILDRDCFFNCSGLLDEKCLNRNVQDLEI